MLPVTTALAALLVMSPARANLPVPELRSVEVLIEPPRDNFAFLNNDQIVYGSASPKGGGGPIVAFDPLTLFFSLMVNAAADARVAEFVRDVAPKVRSSVELLHIKATAEHILQQHAPKSAPTLFLATDGIAAAPGERPASATARMSDFFSPRLDEAVRARAMASTHDALLHLKVLPLFHLHTEHVRVHTHAQLISRSGHRLLDWQVVLSPVDVSRMSAAEVPPWWIEGNYLRFVLHGVQAGVLLVLDDLANLQAVAERERLTEALRAQRNELGRVGAALQSQVVLESMLRTSVCALDPATPAVRYRFSAGFRKRTYSAVALCPDEALGDLYQGRAPFLAWTREGSVPKAVNRPARSE